MTLLKPGDVWDQQEWTKRLVGKRLCNICISRNVGLILRGYRPRLRRYDLPTLVASVVFFGSIAGFFVATSFGVSPIIPFILFVASSITIIIAAPSHRGRREETFSVPIVAPTPLISIESLFDGSDDMK